VRAKTKSGASFSGSFATSGCKIFPQPENELQLGTSAAILLTTRFGGVAMKKPAALALLSTVSPVALLIGSPADAADLARKAPYAAPPPPPVYSWTGCYVGAHVGWGWGQNRFSDGCFSFGSSTGEHPFGGNSFSTSGPLFGGQVGCNYQFAGWSPWAGSNWVVGIQGDFAGTDFDGKGNDATAGVFETGNVSLTSDYLASITARLGLTAFNNQALFYAKGGVAWIHNKWDLSNAGPFFGANNFPEQTPTGWTVGGGAEWTLWSPNWTAFVEYNFYEFNHGQTTSVPGAESPNEVLANFQSGRQTINAVKVGVNYKWW
jgi:outer membrane immunogenic protein